jgi:hypothetical protein
VRFAKAVRYRVEQFLRALTAQHAISERRLRRAAEILSPEARALFVQQAPQDQCHALAVYETLVEREYTNEDLLTAALLHDVGKAAAQAHPWQRSLFVLAQRFAPRALERMLRRGNEGQRDAPGGGHGSRPYAPYAKLVAYGRHAEIGARWAKEAGCSTLTVALIRYHEEQLETCRSEQDRFLAALQAADSVN